MPTPIIVDAHYDLLMDVFRLRLQGETRVIERFYLEDLRAAGVNVLICSLFIPSEYIPEMALRVALSQIGNLHAEMRESTGLFALCRTAKEARTAVGEGKLALFLSFEGADPLGPDIQLLSVFYELGVRFIGLTWSRRNFMADGCHFSPLEEGTPGGLTSLGVQLLKEAARLRMIVDVSHLNDAGFDDVLRFYDGPVIASHSNSRALCPVARNLTDEQIKRLAERGGVIGLNNTTAFVLPDGPERIKKAITEGGKYEPPSREAGDTPCWPGLQEAPRASLRHSRPAQRREPGGPRELAVWPALLDHARHIIEVAGEDHLGLGLDLCEFDKPEAERNNSLFPTYRHVAPFIAALRREFPNAADKLLGENWLRVLEYLG